ncbi:MAG: bifunctional oligoribonuclease/PAP phosphatase NrnA [Spirochaetaceae bacterium]|jgi:phosphoesterase RecJ-like protein|nr:bifunctional oligoribonuclease/PAP phosphatase NrnA [Spirochaetaceae bacterium]
MFAASAPPVTLIDFIKKHSNFLVVGHKEPDGDCAGSQLALCSALRRLGKTAIPVQAGPFKRNEVNNLESEFSDRVSVEARQNAAVIIVDCSSIERTGCIEEQIAGLPTAVIDHHITGKHAGAGVSYIDGTSPATVLLVLLLIKALRLELTSYEAELLFLGLCTDTGFFRHLEKDSAIVFNMAAELVRAGADPKKTFNIMNGGKSLNSRLLLSEILGRAESYFGGRLIISTETQEDSERFGLESRDSDSLYQLLLAIQDVAAVAVIRQESAENCTIGLRSRDEVDVAAVASSLGGGGHKNASGALIAGQISEIKPKVIAAFARFFS